MLESTDGMRFKGTSERGTSNADWFFIVSVQLLQSHSHWLALTRLWISQKQLIGRPKRFPVGMKED